MSYGWKETTEFKKRRKIKMHLRIAVKLTWYLPWQTVYDGCLPWRGSYAQAKEIKLKILEKYS